MATPIPMPYRVASHCQSGMGTALLHDTCPLTTCICIAHWDTCVCWGGGGGGGASDCMHIVGRSVVFAYAALLVVHTPCSWMKVMCYIQCKLQYTPLI